MNSKFERSFEEAKIRIHGQLLKTMDMNEARRLSSDELFQECSQQVEILLTRENYPISIPEKKKLIQDVLDEVFGLGPVEDLLRDPDVSDILVNGCSFIYIERFGILEKTKVKFRDEAQLLRVIQRIGNKVGRHIDESTPTLDARLDDGSRVNAIIPPVSLDGPSLSIRRFGTIDLHIEKLLSIGTLCEEMAEFLEACVRSRQNILISGGTGSGKTSLLNLLSNWIPEGERVVTIEDAAELRLQREHVVRLETRPNNVEGKGEITQRDLLINSLRMRPDRIIIGEVRGSEALDMLQAMNTGHDGSMTTLHANNPHDAFIRLENIVSLAGLPPSTTAIRRQISSALSIIIHQSRLTGGRRKIIKISEVLEMEGETITLQDIFQFNQTGVGHDGNAEGHFEICGARPRVLEQFESEGIVFPDSFFEQRKLLEQ
jgi:pilus assembly protein CpaF